MLAHIKRAAINCLQPRSLETVLNGKRNDKDMEPMCRVCLTSSGVLVDIFIAGRDVFPSLEYMINECVKVKVKRKDKFPKQICKNCISDLHSAYRLKRNYEITINQYNNKSDISDDDKQENTTSLSDQENSPADVINSVPKTKQKANNRKREPALKIKLDGLTTNKKWKKRESLHVEGISEEQQIENEIENENKPDLEEQTEAEIAESEFAKSESDIAVESIATTELPVSESSLIHDKEEPKKKKRRYKPCVCTTCNKVFLKPAMLKIHIRVHTGERPYPCQHCAKSFADRSNLRRHVRLHISGKYMSGRGRGRRQKNVSQQ